MQMRQRIRKNGSCEQRPYEECKACFNDSKGGSAKKVTASELSETDSDECITARMSAVQLVVKAPPNNMIKASLASSDMDPANTLASTYAFQSQP